MSAFAGRGRDIPGGRNKVGSIARGLPLVCLHYQVALQTSPWAPTPPDEVFPPEEVAESPGPEHLAWAVLGALDLEDPVSWRDACRLQVSSGKDAPEKLEGMRQI